jgi:dTDP-4-dehydrorhamnose reductase
VSRPLLVTGAGGMLGVAVLDAAPGAGFDAVGLGRSELDITDPAAVADALARLAPQVVINCAAWTDVDGAESDRAGAFAGNATGPGVLARAAAQAGVRVVHVSTDYVFNGRGTRPYLESDPTDPQCVYGASKLAGELEVLAASERHAIVRTAWLFGAGGRNFVDTMLRIADGGATEVSVVTDQLGCPTWTGDLAQALLALAGVEVGGVLHGAASGACTWNDLAIEVFAAAGRDVRVLASTSAEQQRPAPRPPYSVLGSEREQAPVLPDWREGVRAYLAASGRLSGERASAHSIGGTQ